VGIAIRDSFTGYNTYMQGGLSTAAGFKAGIWSVGTLIFQWVPSLMLSLSTAGSMTLGTNASGASAGPLTSAVTVPQIEAYLQSMSPTPLYQQFVTDWGLFAAVSIFISLILASFMTYCIVQLTRIRRREEQRFAAAAASVAARNVPVTHLRWDRIMGEIHSESEKSWRLAILEADIMLGELLDSLGYKGETMADKMRAVERANFHTIDLAWEAHRARNRIAHESSETPLNPRDVRHTIDLYQKVFREFQFVA